MVFALIAATAALHAVTASGRYTGGARGADAEDAQKLFQDANKAYASGDFAAARDLYEDIVRQGMDGAALDYNLGNTYFRLGQVGRARLLYERALARSPADDDIRYNRDLLQQRIGETPETADGLGGLAGLLWGLTSVANVAFFALLGIGLFRESETLWWGRWLAGIFLALFLTASLAAGRQAAERRGVILVPRAEARTGPSPEESVGFVIPEGQRVVLLEVINDWIQVGLPGKGLKGWVPRDSVEAVRR